MRLTAVASVVLLLVVRTATLSHRTTSAAPTTILTTTEMTTDTTTDTTTDSNSETSTGTSPSTTYFECPPIPPCDPRCSRSTDDRGCYECDCPTSCEEINCPDGQTCNLQLITDSSGNCYPFEPCVPVAGCVPVPQTTSTPPTTRTPTTEISTSTFMTTTEISTSTFMTTTEISTSTFMTTTEVSPSTTTIMCQDITCPSGQSCVMQSSATGSTDGPCYPWEGCTAVCVSETTTQTNTPTPTETTTPYPTTGTTCPPPFECSGPYCRIENINGCPVSMYYDPYCMLFSPCSDDAYCIDTDGGLSYYCKPKVTTTPVYMCAPMPPCYPGCSTIKDSHGCHACDCPTSCEGITCPVGQTCVLQESTDTSGECYPWRPCGPLAVCVPDTTTPCPPIPTCSPSCSIYTNSNGCYACDCPTSCDSITCPLYQTCELQIITDSNGDCYPFEPCVPVAVCVLATPTTESTTITGTTSCPTIQDCYSNRHGYMLECMLFPSDQGGCEECQCWTGAPPCFQQEDFCGSGNTCITLDDPPYYYCVTTLGTLTPTTPSTPTTETTTGVTCGTYCMNDCPFGRVLDANGCPTCNCYTCEEGCGPDADCTQSDNYQYRPNGCVTKPTTTPTTVTTPTTETTTGVTCGTVCDNYCPFGRVQDANGCPTCNCYTCEDTCGPCTHIGDYPYYKCRTPTTPTGTTPTTPTTPTTETTTGVKCGPVCMIYCQYGNVKDVNGCPTCKCFNPCEKVSCLASEMCIGSRLANGSYIGQCIGTTLSTTATTATTSIFECPGITDPPCFPGCDTTYDYRGCRGCNCPTSCEDKTCPTGQICVLQPNPFDGWGCIYFVPCGPNIVVCVPDTTPTPTPCPIPECQRECLPDQNGPDGCPTCTCPNCTCEDLACGPNEFCLFQYPECPPNTTPCPPQPTCAPSYTSTPCPLVKCAPGCVSDTGSDGCPTCECPPSCDTVKCSAGYECQLVDVTCIRYPCFPQPQCLPAEDPCSGTPNRRRCGGRALNRWTYNLKNDACEKFTYYGCTQSPNTFNSPKACKNICKPICSPVACGDDCYTLKRKNNKCPKCICPNPCKGMKCRAGYECKLRETKCDAEPEPYCTRK